MFNHLNKIIEEKNNNYVNNRIKKDTFLNNINGYRLDNEQKRVVYTDEINTLVIAGAGSGKSLTIIAKIKYLLDNKIVKQSEIICISLTNDACNNLRKNLNKENNYNVNILTFHKLCLNIIKENILKISIADDNKLLEIINQYFKNIKDIKIIEDIIKYFTEYIDLTNLDTSNIKTIDNNVVNNRYDYLVSCYLFVNCISYTYKYNKEKSIFILDTTKIIIYHIIDSYKETNNIELFDIEFEEQVAIKHLNKELNKRNIKQEKRKLIDILNNIENYTLYIEQLKKLIYTFIKLFKSNNYKYNYFNEIIDIIKKLKNNNEKNRQLIFIKLTQNIYSMYEYYLKDNNKIDFDDMITNATLLINKYGLNKMYKYVIIDEYQDTSITKYNLIKSIINKTNAKLLVVGDDYQSIYSFTGCTLDIFTNFEKYYGYTKKLFLTNTYRNSKELVNISGKFIQKNKHQIKKELNSTKHKTNPINIIYYNNDFIYQLEKVIMNIDNDKPIMLLGRNNKDVYKITHNNIFNQNGKYIMYEKDKAKKIYFMTVHKSKGLEEENVIIINTQDDIMGFPNKMKDDIVLKYVKNTKEYYPYEEERRLFYVALTRTKNNLYLMVNKNSISEFVKEIIQLKKNI